MAEGRQVRPQHGAERVGGIADDRREPVLPDFPSMSPNCIGLFNQPVLFLAAENEQIIVRGRKQQAYDHISPL